MSDKITAFQHQLLTDAHTRKEFAADPAGYLKKHDIPLPAGTTLPASIPLHEMETAIATVSPKVVNAGLSAIESGDHTAVTKLVEDAYGPKAAPADLAHLKDVLAAQQTGGPINDLAKNATIAVVGAVVAAVVAVPVAVYGRTQTPAELSQTGATKVRGGG